MPKTDRNEKIEALERERANLQKRYEDNGISKAEFKKSMAKVEFQLVQIRESTERDGQPRGRDHVQERKPEFFGD